jgi:hypothetical protein
MRTTREGEGETGYKNTEQGEKIQTDRTKRKKIIN